MLAAVQPHGDESVGFDATETARGNYAPRTRVDSGHVVDGDGFIRRVPKLAVRNKRSDEINGDEQTVVASSDTGSDNERSTPSSSNSSQRFRPAMSDRSISDESVNRNRWSTTQRQSVESPKASDSANQSGSKKKRVGMFNFLTLKEPSTSALEEFAEYEREKARQKGVTSTNSNALGVSSQKLPEYVPKVNSKWDGLPESAHRKTADSKRRSYRNSVTSISTVPGDSKMTKRAFAALSGRPVRDSVQSNTFSISDRTSSSHSSGKPAPALALDLDEEPVENTEDNRPQTFLRDPSPPPPLEDLPELPASMSPPELEGDEAYLQELDASVPNSPYTPPADGSEARPALVGIHYPELDSLAKEAELSNETKHDAVVRANSPQRPVNFSRPQLKKTVSPTLAMQSESRQERNASPVSRTGSLILSPTLKEPFLTDTFAFHSRETGHIPQRAASTLVRPAEAKGQEQKHEAEEEHIVSPISPVEPELQWLGIPEVTMRPPTATSVDTAIEPPPIGAQSQVSLVPSELSQQWQMSPKERLGLGSKLRKNEKSAILPWEDFEEDVENDAADAAGLWRGRLSPALPSPGLESRMKRFSWIGGGRKQA